MDQIRLSERIPFFPVLVIYKWIIIKFFFCDIVENSCVSLLLWDGHLICSWQERKVHKPVVTSLNLSSSSPTSSSSTFLPGKKNPIILLKNWYISWMVSGTTFTYKWKHFSERRGQVYVWLRSSSIAMQTALDFMVVTSKCSFTEIPPTGGRTLLKMRRASWRPDWQGLWGRRTTYNTEH